LKKQPPLERDVNVLRVDLLLVDADAALLDESLGLGSASDQARSLKEIDDPDGPVVLEKGPVERDSWDVRRSLMVNVDPVEFGLCAVGRPGAVVYLDDLPSQSPLRVAGR